MQTPLTYKPVIYSGILLGLGLGGFFDGIVLHQILQWHHMLTSAGYPANSVHNLELNTLVDGLFHATTWILTLAGLFALWRTIQDQKMRLSYKVLIGAMFVGWGLFNLVEGIIDHHILGIHHVRTGVPDEAFWDIGFLVWGAIMLVGGWSMIRSKQTQTTLPQ